MSLRAIARQAGVSPSTVSLALRGSQKIPEATRVRVARIAESLGYRPNAKVTELMSHVRLSRTGQVTACLGLVSFHDRPRPWEDSAALRLVHDGMARRAEELGYRLEPIWLRGPGLTPRRVCGILDARGIEGLLCLGSPDVQEVFPAEFDHFAVVAVGASVAGPLHRVKTHAAGDMKRALDAVHALGYRRPALAHGPEEAVPHLDSAAGAYFAWCHKKWNRPAPVPPLKLGSDAAAPRRIAAWFAKHAPDVIVAVHDTAGIGSFGAQLQAAGIRTPADAGVVALSPLLEGTGFAGFQENHRQLGLYAVELLVDRILHHELGVPASPRLQFVAGVWHKGNSLRLSLV